MRSVADVIAIFPCRLGVRWRAIKAVARVDEMPSEQWSDMRFVAPGISATLMSGSVWRLGRKWTA